MSFYNLTSNTNANATTSGVKGSDVYTADGVGDERVTLNTLLVRGVSKDTITSQLDALWAQASADNQAFLDLWVMLFQNRDIRGGKGERASTELMWQWVAAKMPALTAHMLTLVPEYGCWRDLFALAEKMEGSQIYTSILKMSVEQLRKDEQAVRANTLSANPTVKVSLLAKWIPREDRQASIAKALAKELFPTYDRPSSRMKAYRKMVSAVNKYLKTVEVAMCAKDFSSLEPKAVPGRALKKHMKAYLNEVAAKRKGECVSPGFLRHPEDPDRMECRQNFKDFFAAAKEGKVVAKAANVVFPHELIKKIATNIPHMSEGEKDGAIAQWMGIVKGTRDAGGLRRSLAMCDFSGSMQSSTNGDTPYWVSMALGLLISEVTTDEFKNSFLTFDSNPTVHKMNATDDIVTRVLKIQQSGIGQGLSTDFQKAMDLVLANLKGNRIRPGQEPENLIVITDMGFDAACGSHAESVYTGNRYRHVVKTDGWQTHIQMIREAFKRAGEDMWGVPFVPPRIVIWNVAASFQEFHATKDTEGVVMLSGWSPALFKNLLKGDIRNMTPMEMLRIQLDDTRYEPVRRTIQDFVSRQPPCWSPYLADKV